MLKTTECTYMGVEYMRVEDSDDSNGEEEYDSDH